MLRPFAAALLLLACPAAYAQSIEEKAQLCTACHGESGTPIESVIPGIWGQNAGYLYLQLRDFQKGARKDERMSPVAESLAKEDLLPLAEYFAAKPWPSLNQPPSSAADTKIARQIDAEIVCTSCHLDHYQGDASVPRTGGQQHDYLIKTMLDFRNKTRGNNPGMTDLMNAASEDQLKAMAAYLAGL